MTEICRTCLKEITDGSVIFCLNPNEGKSKAISIRCKLEYCVPELDLDVIPNAVMCSNCCESLNFAHEFKNKCLATESRIQRYIEKIGYVFAYIDLKQIASQCETNTTVCNDGAEETVQNAETGSLDIRNLHCDTRNFFAVPKIAQLLASGEEDSTSHSLKCVHCGYTTSSKPDLQNHEKVHIHKCNKCDFSAPKRQSLIIHMRQHLKKKLCCALCNYKTPYLSTFEEHNKVHNHVVTSSEKHFKCKICNYKARLKLDLKTHTRHCHKSYKCIICDFVSLSKREFVCHMKMHTDVPGYHTCTCYKCGYSTSNKSDLEKHMLVHRNSKTRLNWHINSNGNEYLKPNSLYASSDLSTMKIEAPKAAVETCVNK